MKMNELIRNEYGVESVLRIADPIYKYLDNNDFKTVSDNEGFINVVSTVEYNAFEQGFLRGIAAAKAGMI